MRMNKALPFGTQALEGHRSRAQGEALRTLGIHRRRVPVFQFDYWCEFTCLKDSQGSQCLTLGSTAMPFQGLGSGS